MFCQNCGARLADNDRFCAYCGAMRYGVEVPTLERANVSNARSKVISRWIMVCSIAIVIVMMVQPVFTLVYRRTSFSDIKRNDTYEYYTISLFDGDNLGKHDKEDNIVSSVISFFVMTSIAVIAINIFNYLKMPFWRLVSSFGILLSVVICIVSIGQYWCNGVDSSWGTLRSGGGASGFIRLESGIVIYFVLSIALIVLSIIGLRIGKSRHKRIVR